MPTSSACEFVPGEKHWGVKDVDVNHALRHAERRPHGVRPKKIAASGVKYYIEVANMPTTNDALKFLMEPAST